jgi:hypothetical protein
LEYIIGPKAEIKSLNGSQYVSVCPELIQLCLNCVQGRKMWKDFNLTLQKEIYIEEAQDVSTNDSSSSTAGEH